MKPSPSAKNTFRAKTGFTLVELLVVVLIIAVLAAIAFPLFGRVKANANRTICMNQLRSWGVAFAGYAADHDGKIEWEPWPSIGNDPLSYSPYVSYWTGDSDDRSGFATQLTQRNCPSVKWDKSGGANSPVTYATIRPATVTGVGITGRLNGASSAYPASLIKRPSRFMLMIDAMSGTRYSISTAEEFQTRVKPLTLKGSNLRHSHSVNALFADYSVKSMTWPEVQTGLTYWSTF